MKVPPNPGPLPSFPISTDTNDLGTYHIYQTVDIKNNNQSGSLKIPKDKIPAFYLKAFDDKNYWENAEKLTMLTIDMVSFATGIGEFMELRHLRHLSSLGKIKYYISGVQLISSAGGIMLQIIDEGEDESFCNKLRTVLFYIDLASLGLDINTSKMLKEAATDALDNMPSNLKKKHPEVEDELINILYAGKKLEETGDITKSFFHNARITLKNEKALGKIFGQSKDYTCASSSLKMILYDIGIERSEEFLADLIFTVHKGKDRGASILDIPIGFIKEYRLSSLEVIARGGGKDVAGVNALEKLLKKPGRKAVVSIYFKDFGAHAVVVDKIENGRVFLRDPLPIYKGSSYSVSLKDFKRVYNKKFVTIK